MVYRGVRAVPSSVALWLEQQLEERGIDSIVYTRYILHLLSDDSIDLDDLPQSTKGKNRGTWKSWGSEQLKKIIVVDCLNRASDRATQIESLVDELYVKLEEANSNVTLLQEKTNSENKFDFESLSPNLTGRYYSIFPALSEGFPRRFRSRRSRLHWKKQREDANSNVVKSNENKENIFGSATERMRSRSTVKQSGGGTHKVRSAAKSLDRKDEEVVVRFVRNEMKGRKCLSLFGEEREAKLSRTPGRKNRMESDPDLPMDFQQLLQSPEGSSLYRQPKRNYPPKNFIQCGTNITSSIWTETGDKMEEDEVPFAWEAPKWSEARNSILSTAFKLPFAYEKDVESTSLALANDGSFFSFFGCSNPLNHTVSSGFTEVVPRPHPETKKVTVIQAPTEPIDEDLLTSMKTHFRPIKDDGSGLGYKDGSSFIISTSFEQVKYRRSESGGFHLGSDTYFEFKRPEITSGFVPKFKVVQSEKFCQTEDVDLEAEARPSSAGGDEFFFPGDEQLAEDMVNGQDEEIHSTIHVSGWVTTWPVTSAIWGNNTLNDANSWMLDGVDKPFRSGAAEGHNEHYMRLRNELTEDGEELLSDLSSIHLYLDPDLMDDSNSLQTRCPRTMYTSCIQTGAKPFF